MTSPRDLIIGLPNQKLRSRSRKVGLISKEITEIIETMKTATLDWEDSREHELGVALAAIQIDKPYRIVIIRNNFDNKSDRQFTVFINPVITKFEGKMLLDYEGCLSVKDIYGHVPRYEKVKVKALDENGKEFRITVEGFLARIFQHEVDHNNGILFIDHIKDNSEAFYTLDQSGQLIELDYEKNVKNSSILW